MGARVFLALGSNLGDRPGFLAFARNRLAALPGSRILALSSEEDTAPLGGRDQPAFRNQMVLLETGLAPRALLDAIRTIEREAGRVRRERWDDRTLDIDIVRYGDLTVQDPDLVLPHPGLADRAFWQREIAEIDAGPASPD